MTPLTVERMVSAVDQGSVDPYMGPSTWSAPEDCVLEWAAGNHSMQRTNSAEFGMFMAQAWLIRGGIDDNLLLGSYTSSNKVLVALKLHRELYPATNAGVYLGPTIANNFYIPLGVEVVQGEILTLTLSSGNFIYNWVEMLLAWKPRGNRLARRSRKRAH